MLYIFLCIFIYNYVYLDIVVYLFSYVLQLQFVYLNLKNYISFFPLIRNFFFVFAFLTHIEDTFWLIIWTLCIKYICFIFKVDSISVHTHLVLVTLCDQHKWWDKKRGVSKLSTKNSKIDKGWNKWQIRWLMISTIDSTKHLTR